MAGPQIEDGFTRIAHKILENSSKLKISGTQARILMIVWRYTYGFKRKDAELALSFIAEAIGTEKKQVDRELKSLIDRNIILITGQVKGKTRRLGFNKDTSTWINERRPRIGGRSETVGQKGDGESPKTPTEPSPKKGTKKDNKDNSKDTSNSRNKKTTYSEDSTYFKMADYFMKRVKKVAKELGLEHLTIKANPQKWADDFRLLVERDGIQDKQLILDVMNWVTEDEFWRTNVLSAKKLREKFSDLAIKMRADSIPKKPAQVPDKVADARDRQIRRDEALRKWMDDGHDPDEFRFDG